MSCLPSQSKCEWFELRHFVRQYNEVQRKQYQLEKCLDVNDSSRTQPEVLLTSCGERPIVIERKSVMPAGYAQRHNHEHSLMSALSEKLGPLCQDDAYLIELSAADIAAHKCGKQELAKIANKMVNAIRSAKEKGHCPVTGKAPIAWTFRRNDDDESRRGVTISIFQRSMNLIDMTEADRELHSGAKEMELQLQRAAAKFRDYRECIRVVVIQFFGYSFRPDQMQEIAQRISIPKTIDEVWVAYEEPVSDDDSITQFLCVHRVNVAANSAG